MWPSTCAQKDFPSASLNAASAERLGPSITAWRRLSGIPRRNPSWEPPPNVSKETITAGWRETAVPPFRGGEHDRRRAPVFVRSPSLFHRGDTGERSTVAELLHQLVVESENQQRGSPLADKLGVVVAVHHLQ